MLHLVGSSILLYLIDDARSNTNQCFSTFVRPRPGKFFFYKTRARSQQIYSYIPSQSCTSSGDSELNRMSSGWITSPSLKIRTELAFTLAKNATKPNPVEIIPLQTTRKENNWKTEETLARRIVTLETERIKLVQSLMFMMMIHFQLF